MLSFRFVAVLGQHGFDLRQHALDLLRPAAAARRPGRAAEALEVTRPWHRPAPVRRHQGADLAPTRPRGSRSGATPAVSAALPRERAGDLLDRGAATSSSFAIAWSKRDRRRRRRARRPRAAAARRLAPAPAPRTSRRAARRLAIVARGALGQLERLSPDAASPAPARHPGRCRRPARRAHRPRAPPPCRRGRPPSRTPRRPSAPSRAKRSKSSMRRMSKPSTRRQTVMKMPTLNRGGHRRFRSYSRSRP